MLASALAVGCATAPAETFPLPFQIIAHRGASAYAPENTLPAFEAALRLGAFEVELDVRLTRDERVVLFHDDTLARKTGKKGTVADYDLAQLQKIEIGSWFDRAHPKIVKRRGRGFKGTRLISLTQLFDKFGDELFYHIELKSSEPELPGRVMEAVEAAELRHRVRYTSFDFDQVARIRARDANVGVTLLIPDAESLQSAAKDPSIELGTLQARWIDRAAEARFDQVGIAAVDLSRDLVDYAAAQGLQVRAWRIYSDADMRRAIVMGTHGMTTNWPDRLIPLLVRRMGSVGQESPAAAPKNPQVTATKE